MSDAGNISFIESLGKCWPAFLNAKVNYSLSMPKHPASLGIDGKAAVRRSGASRLHLFAIVVITCATFGFAVSSIDLGSVGAAAKQISAATIFTVGALLLLGALLAAVRLWFMASDLGYRVSPRDAMLALSLGQIAGALTVQFFGQIAARSALLSSRGLSAPANIMLATYERFIAAAVSAAMAVIGAWYLFGDVVLDLQAGGDRLVNVLAGIAVAVTAGGIYGWGSTAIDAIRRQSRSKIVWSIVRSIFLTLAIQLCTVTAYVVGVHSLAPNIGTGELVAASMIVTFAASLPISFAGWGVRELSAVLALGAIGVQNETALLVAISIGALAIVMVIVIAAAATLLPKRQSSGVGVFVPQSEYSETVVAVQFGIPLIAATAVFFQIFVPIGTTLVNVNLADPIVILGGSLFVLNLISRGAPVWRLSRLDFHVAIATIVMTGAFLYGYSRFGWNDWAFTNKLLGWFVLLCYGATGALFVRIADHGIVLLVRTFVAVSAGIVALELLFIAVRSLGVDLPASFAVVPLDGFSQNRNAFAFALLLAVCGSALIRDRTTGWVLGILFSGVWFAGSRASLGALFAVLVVALIVRALAAKDIVFGILVAAAALAVLAALPFATEYFAGPGHGGVNILVFQMTSVSSDLERFKSIADGIELFLSHPFLGGGLGAYASSQETSRNFTVIHSTPIWLLAEMGLIGFLGFAVPAVRIFWGEWTRPDKDQVGKMLLLLLVAFGVMSLVHELLYQRALWLLLGAGLACVPLASKPANAP